MTVEDILINEIVKNPLITTEELRKSLMYNMNQYKIFERLLTLEERGFIVSCEYEGKPGWLVTNKGKSVLRIPQPVVSAGVVLFDISSNKVFLVHPTGQTLWDIPKGQVDAHEKGNMRLTAVRELYEETGVKLDASDLNAYEFQRAVVNDYKTIYMYKYRVDGNPFLHGVPVCKSYFEDIDGEMSPEVDAYAWVKLKHVHKYVPKFLSTPIIKVAGMA